MPKLVEVVGGGLAGCEAALSLANRGYRVRLAEMRPVSGTPAHQTDRLGELVCTNSLKSEDPANAHGQLKREMAAMGAPSAFGDNGLVTAELSMITAVLVSMTSPSLK